MTKNEQIGKILRDRIRSGEWPDNSRIPSECELCLEFNVSRTTMRSALSGLRADNLVVSRPRIGSVVTLPKKSTRPVYLLMGNMSTLFNATLIHHAIKLASSHSRWEFNIYESRFEERLEAELLQKFLENFDAKILMTDIRGDQARRLVIEHPDRIAILGVAPELFGKCIQVSTDIEAGAEQMMTYLLDAGHRRIAYVGGLDKGIRYNVWQRRLKAVGVVPSSGDAVLAPDESQLDITRQSMIAGNAIRGFMKMSDPPTAIYCEADYWGLSMLYAMLAAGLRVPEDMSVSGFDGALFGTDSTSGMNLSTIVQPYEQMLVTALDALENFKGEYSRVLLDPRLIPGQTVSTCPKEFPLCGVK